MRSQVRTCGRAPDARVSASPHWRRRSPTVPDLTGKQVLEQMANQATGGVAGTAIAAATATEIATAPFGTSSGGFNFKLDPATGLLQRTIDLVRTIIRRAGVDGRGRKGQRGRDVQSDELRQALRFLADESADGNGHGGVAARRRHDDRQPRRSRARHSRCREPWASRQMSTSAWSSRS